MNMMDWVGQTLGQYRIEAPLDAGGMGQVFRGMHTYLNRPAAIKVMRANLATNPKFQARFLQEARSAAALKHPNIVEIYDFGEQEGTLYLVMELMTDGSLRTLLRRRTSSGKPWPLSLGLDLVRQAAEGLAEANRLNVVHRDIKPDNLLLNRLNTPGQEQYQLKISDFGLARLAEGSGLTATGGPMGTLAYMSPEQCRGGNLDGRSDLYALGIVLYEIATGYQPFQIDNFNDAVQKHTNVAPLPLRQVRSDVPAAVEDITLRCLAKKPEDRYATGTELAQALRRAMGDSGLETVAPITLMPRQQSSTPTGRTAPQSPVSGMTIAPDVRSLPGFSAFPRVRVLDQNGQTLQVADITSRGLTIGRQSGNDVVLQSEAVSRQHLRVTWDGFQVTVVDLGTSNGTLLGDKRLLPQVNEVWMPRQVIRLGSFWLRLEGPSPQAMQSVPGSLSQTQLRSDSLVQTQLRDGNVSRTQLRDDSMLPHRSQRAPASLAGSGRIGLLVEPAALIITPGQPTMAQVTLVNLGSLVDWFAVTVEGVPPEWLQGPTQEIQLNPGMEQSVALNLNVARTPDNHAKEYPVTIRARSRQEPGESGTAQALWTVQPFKEDLMRIDPRRVTGKGKANYSLTLRNGGNIPARYALSGEDDEQKLIYHFAQNEVALAPGTESRVPLQVQTRRHWLGREQRQPFQIHARPAGSSIPLTAPAEFVNKAVLPGWVLPAVGVVLTAALVLVPIFGLMHPSPPPPPTPTATSQPATVQPTTDTRATTTAQAGAQATATTQANATATAQAGAQATATTQANATATAQASATAVALAQLGKSWTSHQGVTGNYLAGIVWSSSQSKYIAVGNGGTIIASSDGIKWNLQNSPTNSYLSSITWSNSQSQYVAAGIGGMILTSPDGSSWTLRSSGQSNQLNGIASSSSLYVAVGNSGVIVTSNDGSTWAPPISPTSNRLVGITWTGSQFIAVGDNGTILISSNGSTWAPPTSNAASTNLYSVTSAAGKDVAVGDNGTIVTSSDGGSTWVLTNSGQTYELYAVGSSVNQLSATQFVAVGGGKILISNDGSTWSPPSTNVANFLHSVTSSTGQFVTVGEHGAIFTSP